MSPHFLTIGEFPDYYWLWYPGLSPVLVSIAFPIAFHIPVLLYPLFFTYHWISFVFLLHGRPIQSTFTYFLSKFPGLGLALIPDVVVPEAEQRCAWSRNLVPNFCPGRGRTSDIGI